MTSSDRTVLVDASVFITLADTGSAALLAGLDGSVVVPDRVRQESTSDPAAKVLSDAIADGWVTRPQSVSDAAVEEAASHLGRPDEELRGDAVLLAHALVAADPVVVTDDKPLRQTCKALSIPVSGSIGVLVRAVERGDIDAADATDTLYAMDEVGARFSASLVRKAERLIDDAAD
jgi:predicted nucleic acid-binding protein